MAEILWVRRVFDDGWHNAFTDLTYWKGKYYIAFRNAQSHMSVEGKIIVIASEDLIHWNRVGVAINTIGDDRDASMVATDDRLYVYSGSWIIRQGEKVNIGTAPDKRDIWSFCSYTADGTSWSDPVCVYEQAFWLWRVVRYGNTFYSAAYGEPDPDNKEETCVRFLQSNDGLKWEYVSTFADHNKPNESAMRQKPDGSIQILSQADESAGCLLGESKPPYKEWNARSFGGRSIPSPLFFETRENVYLAGRHISPNPEQLGKVIARTGIWRFTEEKIEHVLNLPSGGDNSYCGSWVQKDGTVLLSYYSQHEVKRSGFKAYPSHIYLACLDL